VEKSGIFTADYEVLSQEVWEPLQGFFGEMIWISCIMDHWQVVFVWSQLLVEFEVVRKRKILDLAIC